MNEVIDNAKNPEPKFFLADEITHWLKNNLQTSITMDVVEGTPFYKPEYSKFYDGRTITTPRLRIDIINIINGQTIAHNSNTVMMPDIITAEIQCANMRALGECLTTVQKLQAQVNYLQQKVTELEPKQPTQ